MIYCCLDTHERVSFRFQKMENNKIRTKTLNFNTSLPLKMQFYSKLNLTMETWSGVSDFSQNRPNRSVHRRDVKR